MSKSTIDELVEVLGESRELLARPDNNFIWSYWDSATDALLEFDAFITQIESGDTSGRSDLKVVVCAHRLDSGGQHKQRLGSGVPGAFREVRCRHQKSIRESVNVKRVQIGRPCPTLLHLLDALIKQRLQILVQGKAPLEILLCIDRFALS